jgi:hypothetical protein
MTIRSLCTGLFGLLLLSLSGCTEFECGYDGEYGVCVCGEGGACEQVTETTWACGC